MNALNAGSLRLEPLLASHASEMFQVLSDPAIYEFENQPPPSVDWLAQRCRRLETRGPLDASETWLNWVIRLPSGGLAGYVQATIMQGGTAYIAYELASEHWRQGIGSRSVAAMLTELKLEYKVTMALAVLKAVNSRSRALLQKLGFQEAAPLQAVRPACESDEIVMYLRVGGDRNAV